MTVDFPAVPAFLFTDIESSTRLWEEHSDEMATALARHDAILRDSIADTGGEVVKSTGDGLLAIFAAIGDALRAALASQLALQSEAWSTPSPLRVRMGLHVGEAEQRAGDYFGTAVNRAARIMAAAHGGQVLVSGVAAEMSSHSLPEGAEMRDLGVHRLKDLSLPEHLYQLLHHGIATEFPPPATLEARPHNLPIQMSEFFGRESELSSIQLMLESPTTRILTLTGPGGAGKTRLGLQVAAEQMSAFRDGVFFVDLAPETDPGSAYEAIVRALDLPVSGEGDPLDVIKARVRDRQMLLVLDNFEQVMAAATGVVEIAQNAPEAKVLVTSREPLRVRAERVFPIPALSLPHPDSPTEEIADTEAVRLFVERARSVRPDFTVTDENASVIAEICLRLDGLPLAIELAAARLNVFSPRELMDRLRTRLDVLGAGGRDLPARQRTLWGAIAWSYELLDAVECRLFEMMSVFSPTRLQALEAVASAAFDEESILDALGSLVDKSLIRSDDTDGYQRFSMLQTIKEFAAERLADDAAFSSSVRRAHAEHFSMYASSLQGELRSEGREPALAELTSEVGNLRAAWRYWVAEADLERMLDLIDTLWALHDAKGWYHAAIELAHDALGVLAANEASPERAAEELTLRTSLARALMAVQGYTVEVEEAFKRVLELVGTGGTSAQRFPVLRTLATYYMNIADFGSALELGWTLLELAEQEGEKTFFVDGHYVVGAAAAFSGDIESGMSHLDKAIELFDPTSHPAGRYRLGPNQGVIVRVASGLMLWQRGDLGRATARLDDALELARELNHPVSLAYGLYHNGLLHVFRGRFELSMERAAELAAVAEEHEYPVWSTLASVLRGVSLTGTGQVEEGLILTEAAVDLYRGLTTPPVFWPMILSLRAFVFALSGDLERALGLVDEAIAGNGPGNPVAPDMLMLRGDILRMFPEQEAAAVEDAYQAAIDASREFGLRTVELESLTRLVELRRATGQSPDGSEELRRLLGMFDEGLDEHNLAAAASLLS